MIIAIIIAIIILASNVISFCSLIISTLLTIDEMIIFNIRKAVLPDKSRYKIKPSNAVLNLRL